MGNERTVLRKGKPRFAINETAYARVSATKGFIEPLIIANIEFDPARTEWVYTWNRNTSDKRQVSPIKLAENELVTLCEALPIQISVLNRELLGLQTKYAQVCPGTEPAVVIDPRSRLVYPGKDGRVVAPAPRFGVREVVYLRETAEVVGRLESYAITDISWSKTQWLYSMYIKRRPGRTMTVGDRDDMSRDMTLAYPESELCTVCEALPLAINFMTRAISRAQARLASLCPCPSSGSE